MCGIFGVIYRQESEPLEILQERLRRVDQALKHRGPNDHGIWISGDRKVAFLHRRLSIIDLSAGARQPMTSSDNRGTITFNGEIYNYRALREELGGGRFQTKSDTEVLLEGLREQGAGFLPRLDGMFAFGYFDLDREQVLLATDPAGKKPLYTYCDESIFAFASEIKAFEAFTGQNLHVDRQCLKEYMVFGYVPYPNTVYRGVQKLPAGHFQIVPFQGSALRPRVYWDLPIDAPDLRISYADAQVEVRRLIRAAVQKRLVSDVPIGCFLSGGLDSSVITLEAARALAPQKLKTFSVGFDLRNKADFPYDESPYARTVAAIAETDHHELRTGAYIENPEKILGQFDEPFADSSLIPTFLLCRETAKHVTVALSGDGGDELFGGYLRFRATLLSHRSAPLWKLALAPFHFPQAHPRSWKGYVQRFKGAMALPSVQRFIRWNSYFSENELSDFLDDAVVDTRRNLNDLIRRTDHLEIGKRLLYVNFKSYLFDDLLPKVDRMSMINGLEVRCPFLDRDLIDFVWRLPRQYKFTPFRGKRILKQIYRTELGADIVDRKKQGFALPIEEFIGDQGAAISFPVLDRLFPRAHLDPFRTGRSLAIRNFAEKSFLLRSADINLRERLL